MKNLTALSTLAILFFFISCKKTDTHNSTNTLTGKWVWESTVGGIAGINQTPVSTGKNIVLTFTGKNQYTILTNDKVTEQGTYGIENKKDMYNISKDFIAFFSFNFLPVKEKIIEKVNDNLLVLKDNFMDGYTITYKTDSFK